MIRTSGNVVIPIVTWAASPPLHEITCILSSNDGKEIATGAVDGNIILWTVSDNTFVARWMIIGHRSCVRNLCLANVSSDVDLNFFFSHSGASEMALWSWHDGKCLEFKIDTHHHHTHIKSHQPSFLQHRLLFCSGRYPHIVVLHAMSLSVLFTLASQSLPNWISAFMVCSHPKQQQEIVLGFSLSNVVTLWTLTGIEVQGETKYEHESKPIKCSSTVLHAHCFPRNPRCVLLVTSRGWQLMDASSCNVFLTQPGPKGDPLVAGEFINASHIEVQCRSGAIHIYRLAIRASGHSIIADAPVLLARLSLPQADANNESSSPASRLPKSPWLSSFAAVTQQSIGIVATGGAPLESQQRILAGTLCGQLVCWSLARLLDAGRSSSEGGGVGTAQKATVGQGVLLQLKPTTATDLHQVWKRYPPKEFMSNISGRQHSQRSSLRATPQHGKPQQAVRSSQTDVPVQVTACIQLISTRVSSRQAPHLHSCRLAFGLSSGRIVVTRLTDFLQATYWKSVSGLSDSGDDADSNNDDDDLYCDGHQGPVLSLLHPASASENLLAALHIEDYSSAAAAQSTTWDTFNPDHLLSGGADFTIRLWGLDAWSDSCHSHAPGSPWTMTPLCLAVFCCHAAPCIGLTVGPPTPEAFVSQWGNFRLSSCVCAVASDGSVSLLHLRENRLVLATNPGLCTFSPVAALGWRPAQSLLLIAHLDGQVEIWDLLAGCLDRLESGQQGTDLFEQAHYIIEVQPSPNSFGASVLPFLSSLPVGDCESRSPVESHHLAFMGSVNSSESAGASRVVAQPQLHRWGSLTRSGRQTAVAARLVPVRLHAVGSTLGPMEASPLGLACGPAAFVFHWDTEAIIADLSAHAMTNALPTEDKDIFQPRQAYQVDLLRLFFSLLHPWGVENDADHAIRACCGLGDDPLWLPERPGNDEKSSPGEGSGRLPHLSGDICLGRASKHGCVSLSMPGWPHVATLSQCGYGAPSGQTVATSRRLHLASDQVTTNLMLANLSLCESLAALDQPTGLLGTRRAKKRSAQRHEHRSAIFQIATEQQLERGNGWRSRWLRYAALLCGRLLDRLVLRSAVSSIAVAGRPTPLDLELLVQKWQDRMLPIRYAARTLLLSYLDHLGPEGRHRLVLHWSKFLPQLSSLQASSPGPHRQNQPSASLPHTDSPIQKQPFRKQSLPAPTQTDNHWLSQRLGDVGGSIRSPVSISSSELSNGGGGLAHSAESLVPKLDMSGGGGPTPLSTHHERLESVSLNSLNQTSASFVADTEWWDTLAAYRVSAREHARMQAVAIVLLGVLGCRYGGGVRRRHPATASRDLTAVLVNSSGGGGGGAYLSDKTFTGLSIACYASPDSASVGPPSSLSGPLLLNGLDSGPETVEHHEPMSTARRDSASPSRFAEPLVPLKGFNSSDYQVARATCQCLLALLHHRTVLMEAEKSVHSNGSDHSSTSTSSTAVSRANRALVSLITSNANSTLRRAAIDLLGRGFVVWEPYVDLVQVINALLALCVSADVLLSGLNAWDPLPDRVDLARTAREALWAIAFARPKSLALTLSLEVRRCGSHLTGAPSSSASSATVISSGHMGHHQPQQHNLHNIRSLQHSLEESSTLGSQRRDSSLGGGGSPFHPFQATGTGSMTVMMASPTIAAHLPVAQKTSASYASFGAYQQTAAGRSGSGGHHHHHQVANASALNVVPILAARDEIVRLMEQLCMRRSADVVAVLPEIVEVVMACLDRTRLKERGLDYLFPIFRQFCSFSSHTRLQKACVGGVSGSLTFFDFKIGRYFFTTAHRGPVTAVHFHSDGRLVATYSQTESCLRIWQLHTTGIFGMGGQQVKSVSVHPVPSFGLPSEGEEDSRGGVGDDLPATDATDSRLRRQQQQQQHVSADLVSVWLDWPEARLIHLVTHTGVRMRVNL